MRFLMMFKPEQPGQDCGDHAEMERFVARSFESGELLATGGLFAASNRVHRSRDRYTVTDGPYAETKEVIAGFALMELASHEAALESVHRFLTIAGDGTCDIHPIADAPQ